MQCGPKKKKITPESDSPHRLESLILNPKNSPEHASYSEFTLVEADMERDSGTHRVSVSAVPNTRRMEYSNPRQMSLKTTRATLKMTYLPPPGASFQSLPN